MENNTDSATAPPTTAVPQAMWLVSEENQTWAVPKRPKFVIGGELEEVNTLITDIEASLRSFNGGTVNCDTKLVARRIYVYADAAHYVDCENAFLEAARKREFQLRSTAKFFGCH